MQAIQLYLHFVLPLNFAHIVVERLIMRLRPGPHCTRLFRKEWLIDTFYLFFNSFIVVFILVNGSAFFQEYFSQVSFLRPVHAFTVKQHAAIQAILTLVIFEFVYYWVHFLSHKYSSVFRFHYVHHSPQNLDYLATFRTHFIEHLWSIFKAIFPALLGLSLKAIDLYAMMIMSITWVHMKFYFRIPILERIIVTPFYHHWHHEERVGGRCNYAFMFPAIDYLWGTYYLPDHWPAKYGLGKIQFPKTIWGQMMIPFVDIRGALVKWKKRIRFPRPSFDGNRIDENFQ